MTHAQLNAKVCSPSSWTQLSVEQVYKKAECERFVRNAEKNISGMQWLSVKGDITNAAHLYFQLVQEMDELSKEKNKVLGPVRIQMFAALAKALVKARKYDLAQSMYSDFKIHIHAYERCRFANELYYVMFDMARRMEDANLFLTYWQDMHERIPVMPKFEDYMFDFQNNLKLNKAEKFFVESMELSLSQTLRARLFVTILQRLHEANRPEKTRRVCELYKKTNPLFYVERVPGVKRDPSVSKGMSLVLCKALRDIPKEFLTDGLVFMAEKWISDNS
jgi:hypothetical protein